MNCFIVLEKISHWLNDFTWQKSKIWKALVMPGKLTVEQTLNNKMIKKGTSHLWFRWVNKNIENHDSPLLSSIIILHLGIKDIKFYKIYICMNVHLLTACRTWFARHISKQCTLKWKFSILIHLFLKSD